MTAIVSIRDRTSPYWDGFAALYRGAFAENEREPEALLATRVKTGRYRLRVSLNRRGQMTGCYVIDVVPAEDYALLCYLAVDQRWRKSGLGQHLCGDAVDWFQTRAPVAWLLVEARPRAARLYVRCGFARLDLDYRVPYIDAPGVQSMYLLMMAAGGMPSTVDGHRLAAVIRHLYTDGYQVAAQDRRLHDQLSRVPGQVRWEHAPVQAAG